MFNTQELGEIVKEYVHVVINDGEKVRPWRDALGKYSALPGIRELYDFVFVRNPGDHMKMKVRRLCYTGNLQDSGYHVKRGYRLEDSVIPTDTYSGLGLTHELSESKTNHLRQMNNDFIPSERRLPIV